MEQNLSFWKKLLILISFNLLVFSTLQASRIENMPATLKQPDGSQIACLLSGDEYYNWVSDTNGYTLLKNAQGWIVYAALADGALVPTEYLAYSIDPRTVGLVPYLNISAEKRTQIRANFINQTAAAAQLRHPAQAAPQNAPASNTYRTGTLNNIVIYISFPDADFTTTHNQILPNFNGTIRGSSMQQYYKDISNNNFHINSTFFPAQSGTTVLSYQAPHNRSYYEIDNDEPTGRIIEHTLLHDAVVSMQSAIEAAFTGVQLDYNNDGNVDNIIFVVQGNTGGWSTLLWPHRWVLYTYQPYYDNELYLNGKMVWDYNLVLENHVGVSTLVHETYHTLGAPDLYRYQGDFDPVGSWDIMASNATPPQSSSAHISHKYGEFLIDNDIQEITASGTYTLYDIWDRTPGHKKAYKLATSNPDEWIYLEYRKKTSEVYESNIPGEGIVIYRVKTSLNGNSNGPPDEVYIYRPNASDNSTDGSLSTAFFSSQSGRTFFSSTSNPPCFLTDGSLCNNFTISTISASGSSTMTFNVSFTSGSNGCTTATYGQWPLDIFTPNCT
ncbi:MAG: M6 family metalloprotease domain-containing protein, partial [Bacteroidales bacterium]|nr:M6 family metalloprotease domain-containing protein [Bacteroidales bacterium]